MRWSRGSRTVGQGRRGAGALVVVALYGDVGQNQPQRQRTLPGRPIGSLIHLKLHYLVLRTISVDDIEGITINELMLFNRNCWAWTKTAPCRCSPSRNRRRAGRRRRRRAPAAVRPRKSKTNAASCKQRRRASVYKRSQRLKTNKQRKKRKPGVGENRRRIPSSGHQFTISKSDSLYIELVASSQFVIIRVNWRATLYYINTFHSSFIVCL